MASQPLFISSSFISLSWLPWPLLISKLKYGICSGQFSSSHQVTAKDWPWIGCLWLWVHSGPNHCGGRIRGENMNSLLRGEDGRAPSPWSHDDCRLSDAHAEYTSLQGTRARLLTPSVTPLPSALFSPALSVSPVTSHTSRLPAHPLTARQAPCLSPPPHFVNEPVQSNFRESLG